MKTLKNIFKWAGIIILILIAVSTTLYLIYLRPFMKKMEQTSVINYDKDLTLVLGGGGNSGILVADSLVMVIDTKMDKAAEDLYNKAKTLAGNRPIMVVNTHIHPDHCGGNKYFAGDAILAGGNYTRDQWLKEAGKESLPNQWLKYRLDIKMNDDTATLFNLGRNAHTASDVFVYLHRRKLLFGGDVILNKQAPAMLGVADPDGYLAAFDTLTKLFDIKTVVPGHGPVGGPEVIDNFRHYFKDMETAAADNSKKSELVEKYSTWTQIPFMMSPGATIRVIKNKNEAKHTGS